jgi:hypothetical protein
VLDVRVSATDPTAPTAFVRLLRQVSLSATGLLWLVVSFWPSHGIDFDCGLPARRIQREQGLAYTMITPARALLFISPDDADHPNRAKVTILENGRALGPAHSQHSFIRERGDGAFSQWGERLYFSSSDNSDPRSNGRTYSVRSNFQPASGTYLLILALGAISILLNRNSLAEAAHWLRGNVPTRPPSRHGIRDKVLLVWCKPSSFTKSF